MRGRFCYGLESVLPAKRATCKPPACGARQRLYHKNRLSATIELFKLLCRKAGFMAKQENSLARTKRLCKHHIARAPKYRRKNIYNQYRESLGKILRKLCSYKGVEIIEGRLMPDHADMPVGIPTKISVSSFMGYLKGKSALMMYDAHANLKYKLGNRRFWREGDHVTTAGLNEATIAKYIRAQEQHDQAINKFSVKERADPFKTKQAPGVRRDMAA